jgi:hypothetical protein
MHVFSFVVFVCSPKTMRVNYNNLEATYLHYVAFVFDYWFWSSSTLYVSFDKPHLTWLLQRSVYVTAFYMEKKKVI